MKKLVFAAFVVIPCISTSGCGSSPDSLMKDQIKLLNELADALESGADQSKIDAIGKKMKENEEKMNGIKLSEDEKKQLFEKHKDDLTKAVQRMMGALMKGQGNNTKLPDLGGLGGAPASKQGEGGSKK